jgi:glycosyltransferase involved in cell wall biosynthesis
MRPQPLVSINVPCYQQLPYARRAIESILAQSFRDYELTLLDDGASDEYRDYVASIGDARVHYHRNPVRLGAMRNMFAAIKDGHGKYTFAFHEDDLVGRHYLEAAVDILERHARCGFVAGEMREFRVEPSADQLAQRWDGRSYDEAATAADYLRLIFRGIEPMFGSVVYRREAVDRVEPDYDRYATLVDRPFLLAILERWSAAIVRAPMVWYRYHPDDDGRHREMTAEHILALFETYRAAWPRNWSAQDAALFYAYSGPWLSELFRLTPPRNRPMLARFAYDAWKRGVHRARLRGPLGIRAIARDAIGKQC